MTSVVFLSFSKIRVPLPVLFGSGQCGFICIVGCHMSRCVCLRWCL
jgi:hypothetical protein